MMTNEERSNAIETFIERWDEAIKAANEITDFKWSFEVSITSDNQLIEDRGRTISGINESFAKNNMTWSSNG